MSLIKNERTKLTAAWFNTIAAASVTTGFIAPIVAVSLGLNVTVSALYVGLLSLFWIGLGLGVHLFARQHLGRLKE